jgi:tungstate transport system ATP-binding protein
MQDLIIERGGHQILRVDHLQIQEGEVLAVVGPNGAGKTTFLLALCQLIRGSKGHVRWRDHELSRREERDFRRNIALVLQTPQLLDRTVFENVAVGMRFRGLPRVELDRRVGFWLDRLGIAELWQRRARSLSGGEAQRVSLARAFALQPQILLLDEPFSALDTPTRSQLLLDFQSLLKETGQTAIFITHDLEEALMLGDRMA